MPRVFVFLSICNFLALLLSAALGYLGMDPAAESHVLMAVGSLLFVCFVQVAAFTYCGVAGKLTAQALHLGRFDLAPLRNVRRIKSKMIGQIGLLIFTVVIVTATGATHWRSASLVTVHLGSTCVLFLVFARVSYREYSLLCEMSTLVAKTVAAYTQQRKQPTPCATVLSLPVDRGDPVQRSGAVGNATRDS